MRFIKTELDGAFIIELDMLEDDRGFFARTWCQREFEDHGLVPNVVQANLSYNKKAGTMRGMHYQVSPHEETKIIRCTKGALYDVIVDLRPDSSTYKQWIGVELTEDNYKMLYVPANFAHGYITLQDETEVMYFVSESYSPGSERGIRWNDLAIKINWPVPINVISEKDSSWPDFA